MRAFIDHERASQSVAAAIFANRFMSDRTGPPCEIEYVYARALGAAGAGAGVAASAASAASARARTSVGRTAGRGTEASTLPLRSFPGSADRAARRAARAIDFVTELPSRGLHTLVHRSS